MTSPHVAVQLSLIDEERFGVRIARADDMSHATLREVLAFCHQQQARMLIARCPTKDVRTVQTMERAGFLLMDTLVYYARDLKRLPTTTSTPTTTVRLARPDDAAEVERIAGDAFRGYFGHYHADERLDPAKCDEGYRSWAVRSVNTPGVADAVLVAEGSGTLLGFATLRMNKPEEGEGVLFGVAPEAQGRGIYRLFMESALAWCAQHGASVMVVSTQVTNLAVQKVWVRVGFEPHRSYYTFHKWFDEVA